MTTSLPRVRQDTLPEGTAYPDDGCHIASRCVDCPASTCVMDGMSTVYHQESINRRRALIKIYREAGYSVEEIADRTGVSGRTVHRDTQRIKEMLAAAPEDQEYVPQPAPPSSGSPEIFHRRLPLRQIRPGYPRPIVLFERG